MLFPQLKENLFLRTYLFLMEILILNRWRKDKHMKLAIMVSKNIPMYHKCKSVHEHH
jgi:hypothetical protein